MASRSSEARRRRIAERGSDRLAYITGRIDSLPPPAPVKPFDDETVTVSEPLISSLEDLRPHLPGQIEDFHEEDNAIISSSTTENSSALPLQKCDTGIESIGALNSNIRGKEQPHLSHRAQDSSAEVSSKDFSSTPQLHLEHPFAFTLKELSNAIYASESTRRYCSIAIALLVVLSSPGFPLPLPLINFTMSIINFRPFYLVLFTNLTVVIARLVSEKQRNEQGNRKGAPSLEGQGLVVHVGKALEAGLVLQKAMEAALADFSLYTVIIVSGLSILRKFGF